LLFSKKAGKMPENLAQFSGFHKVFYQTFRQIGMRACFVGPPLKQERETWGIERWQCW
jgi:hypothetical protein